MRFLLLASFLLMAAAAFGQDPEIQAMEKKWASAIKAMDAAALEKILGDQLVYAHSTGIVDTKKDYIAKVGSGKQKYEGVEQQSATIKAYGDTVIVHARMHMWGVNQSGKFDDQLMMLHTWVKRNGNWLLVAHQTTKLK
jgi:ketosteroid isomerase-like protein